MTASMMPIPSSEPDFKEGELLSGDSSSVYAFMKFIAYGHFGKVAKCQKVDDQQIVAIKVFNLDQNAEDELAMLKTIRNLHLDAANVVQFIEEFNYMGHTCLAFEMLEMDLYGLRKSRPIVPMAPNEIRPIAQQLLVALDSLKGLGIVHTDVKPDNIMLVNSNDQPFKVKLIDFGFAVPASALYVGQCLQAPDFRAPEVLLGLPLSEAIDMWGLGCTLLFLYLEENLFPSNCNYLTIRRTVQLLGQLDDQKLENGIYMDHYFTKRETLSGALWRLRTPEEFLTATGIEPKWQDYYFRGLTCLEELIPFHPYMSDTELEDTIYFVDLLKKMLNPDAELRITPQEALKHPFISMSHLKRHPHRMFETVSRHKMRVCAVPNAAETTNKTPVRRLSTTSEDSTSLDYSTSSEDSTSLDDSTTFGGSILDEDSTWDDYSTASEGSALDEDSTASEGSALEEDSTASEGSALEEDSTASEGSALDEDSTNFEGSTSCDDSTTSEGSTSHGDSTAWQDSAAPEPPAASEASIGCFTKTMKTIRSVLTKSVKLFVLLPMPLL